MSPFRNGRFFVDAEPAPAAVHRNAAARAAFPASPDARWQAPAAAPEPAYGRSASQIGEVRLKNTTPPHRKFYYMTLTGADASRWVVDVGWGRIGNSPQRQQKYFPTRVAAESFIVENIRTRLSHGYYIDGLPTLPLIFV